MNAEWKMANKSSNLWMVIFAFVFCCLATSTAYAKKAPTSSAITVGPVVGAVSSNEAKIFVRLSHPGKVKITYWRPGESPLISEPVTAIDKNDLTAQIELTALKEDSLYYYDVLVDDLAQKVVRQDGVPASFQTFPAAGQPTDAPIIFTVIADLLKPNKKMPIYEAVAAEQPRFILQIGDFPHGNSSGLREFRKQYRKTVLGNVDYKEWLGIRTPFFYTWDDHDYGLNNADKTSPTKKESLRAFVEYHPTPKLANQKEGVWHSFLCADADFFMLDLRSQRDPEADPESGSKSMLDGNELGALGQKEWLKHVLSSSTAKWKFIISSVPFNATAKPSDAWAAYNTERSWLVKFIQDNGIKNVIILSGDMHAGGRLDNGDNSDFPEMNVPQVQSKRDLHRLGCSSDPHNKKGRCGTWSEGVVEKTGGYGVVEISPETATEPAHVILRIKDWHGDLKQNTFGEAQELVVFDSTK